MRQSENYLEDFINPAVEGTMGLLRSAAKSSSVKRIVVTSSIAVLDIGQSGKITGKYFTFYAGLKTNSHASS